METTKERLIREKIENNKQTEYEKVLVQKVSNAINKNRKLWSLKVIKVLNNKNILLVKNRNSRWSHLPKEDLMTLENFIKENNL